MGVPVKKIFGVVFVLALACLGAAYFVGVLPGTDAYRVRRAKALASAALVDPSSAQFRNVKLSDLDKSVNVNHRWVCGEINGRNRMGAYAGFTPFYVDEAATELQMLTEQRPDEARVNLASSECEASIAEGRYNRYICEQRRDLMTKRNEFDGWVERFKIACGLAPEAN